MLPTDAPITQEYGYTAYALSGAYGGAPHNGMDFGLRYSTYRAPATMTIERTAWDNSGFGWLVTARDVFGYRLWFAHNSQYLASVGTVMVTGQAGVAISGTSGMSSAPHLHFGTQLPGYTGYAGYINPRNWPGFNVEGGDAQMDTVMKQQLIDECYRRVLGVPADSAALSGRLNQTREQILADLFNSQYYVDLATAGMMAVSGTSLSPQEIKAHAAAQEPVPQLIYNWAKDRYKTVEGVKQLEELKSKLRELAK